MSDLTIPRIAGIPVHTYSIVARDPDTGQLGVAVQSHWFAVGAIVTWAEAGVGAVATQALVDPSYGMLGLGLMRAGRSADDSMRGLLEADRGRDVRQVAMIDARGGVAAHTGARTIAAAGHISGSNFSVQANMMLNDQVWPAMARGFEQARGDLADRMLAALDSAEAAGGDIRGRQSAAMLVVAGKGSGQPWRDRVVDLRVDDHRDPLGELRRLLKLKRAYDHMAAGDDALGAGDHAAAVRAYAAARSLEADNIEMAFWPAVALVNIGAIEDALPIFREVFARDRNWLELARRLVKAGMLLDDAQLMARIEAQAVK